MTHLDVRDYDADPTGSADSTEAIQEALDEARTIGAEGYHGCKVLLGPGTYKVTDTLVLTNGDDQYGAVQLLGDSIRTTHLIYEGSNDGRPAVVADKQSGSSFGNFWIRRAPSDKGTSIGLRIGGLTGTGTQSGNLVVKPMMVSGFNVGVLCGDEQGAGCSEIVFEFLAAQYCDTGVVLAGYNTINFLFEFLNIAYNDAYGMFATSANGISVDAGAGVRNALADFRFDTYGKSSIRQYRTEGCNRFLISAGGVSVHDCSAPHFTEEHDGIVAEIAGGGELPIHNSHLLGRVVGYGHVSLYDSTLVADQWLSPKSGEEQYFGGASVTVQNSTKGGMRENGRWIGLGGGGLRMVYMDTRDGVRWHGEKTRGVGALDFQRNGAQHYETLKCASNESLSIDGSTPFTISAWVMLRNDGPVDQGKFVTKVGEWDIRISHPTWNNGNVRFGMSVTDGTNVTTVYAQDVGAPEYGRWYHVVGTYDGDAIRCHVDAEEPAEAAHLTGIAGSEGEFCVGSQFFLGPYPTVRLGRVGFWKGRALTDEEIAALPVKYADLTTEQKEDLVSWYDWDQESSGLPPLIDWQDKHGENMLSAAVPNSLAFDPVSAVGPS